MTSRLLTTGRLRAALSGDVQVQGSIARSAGSSAPTPILDYSSPEITRFIQASLPGSSSPLIRLRRAHAAIARLTRPVYGVDERQAASTTLRRGRGSCSQRLAVLEAVARGQGIVTRSRGLLVDGGFWSARFGALAPVVPDLVLLAWPEFQLDEGWTSGSDLFPGATDAAPAFANDGPETLFDAIARGAASWTPGASSGQGAREDAGVGARTPPERSLHGYLRRDLGTFDSRDLLFARHGQNLPAPVRLLADPFSRHWSPASRG